jgi:hypothetical protein
MLFLEKITSKKFYTISNITEKVNSGILRLILDHVSGTPHLIPLYASFYIYYQNYWEAWVARCAVSALPLTVFDPRAWDLCELSLWLVLTYASRVFLRVDPPAFLPFLSSVLSVKNIGK